MNADKRHRRRHRHHADPARHLPNGTRRPQLPLACNERRFDRDCGHVDRPRLVLHLRELLAPPRGERPRTPCTVGDPVVVRGRLATRSYDTARAPRSVTDLEADVVGPDLTRCTAVVTRIRRAEAAAPSGVAVVAVDGQALRRRRSSRRTTRGATSWRRRRGGRARERRPTPCRPARCPESVGPAQLRSRRGGVHLQHAEGPQGARRQGHPRRRVAELPARCEDRCRRPERCRQVHRAEDHGRAGARQQRRCAPGSRERRSASSSRSLRSTRRRPSSATSRRGSVRSSSSSTATTRSPSRWPPTTPTS